MNTQNHALGSKQECDLSIILPCYNAENVIPDSMDKLEEYLGKLEITWEILVVDDGSVDGSARLLESLHVLNFQLIKLMDNRGKGKAVVEGMKNARGKYRIFMDIDLPFQLDVIEKCLKILTKGKYKAVFGNRKLEKTVIDIKVPIQRLVLSKIFNIFVGQIIGRKDLDTQCGFKGFTKELAAPLFRLLTIERFLFDVELCLLLSLAHIDIISIPVRWVNNSPSTISFWGTGLQVLCDIGRIWWHKLLRHYDVSEINGVYPDP